MKLFRSVFAICLQNFRKWKTDYRIWVIAALLIIMIQIYVDDMRKISQYLQTDVPIWIFPFLSSQFHTKVIFTLPVILLFCNAPFTDSNQIFVYSRAGQKKWLLGQIMYIIIASAAYYLYLLIVSLLSTVFIGSIGLEWGKTINTLSVSDVGGKIGCFFIEVPSIIVDFFTPLQAVGFTFLMSWLCAIFLGLIIFLCNSLFKTKALGIFISSALVILNVLVEHGGHGGFSRLINYSPVSWNTLDNIDIGGLTTNPSFTYCLSVYLILIAILIGGIFILCKKPSLDLKG